MDILFLNWSLKKSKKSSYIGAKTLAMKANLLFDISHLRFTGQGEADINAEMLFVTNIDKKRTEFFTQAFIKTYGLNDTRYSPNSVFAYSQIDIPDVDATLIEEIKQQFEEVMLQRIQLLESFLFFLWLEKDNSVGLWYTIGQIPSKNIVAKVGKSMSFYNCKGLKENCEFTPEELKKIGALTLMYQKICPPVQTNYLGMVMGFEFDQHGIPFRTYLQAHGNHISYNEQNCIQRAFHFITIGRNQNVLIYKIAYYMAAIECLFTTDSKEITKTMSYRVAFYIGKSKSESLSIFNKVNKAYNIRSKFLHGQPFSSVNDYALQK